MKVSISKLQLYLVLYVLFELFFIPVQVYNYLSYVVIIVLLIAMLVNNKVLSDIKFVIPYFLVIPISTIINYGINNKITLLSVFYALTILETFYVVRYYIIYNSFNKFINLIYKLSVIVMIINDIFIFANVIFQDYYLIGSKFRVVYLHCLVAVLLYQKAKKHKVCCMLCFTGYEILISYVVDCTTGVLAALALFILVIWGKKLKVLMCKVKSACIFWGIVNFVFASITSVLQVPFVQYVLTNILKENSNLTGRTKIYEYLGGIISENSLWGYGHMNAVVERVVGYGNAQNGTLRLVIDYGCIGLIAFAIIVVFSFWPCSKGTEKQKNECFPFVMLVYVLFICSIVEVSFNYYFYLGLAAIFGSTYRRESKKTKANTR